MKNRNYLAPLFMGIVLLLVSGILFSQNTSKDSYQPQLGQAGKDVIWYPTPKALVDTMIEMAKLTPADYLVDLGSGDGRIVIAAAKRGIRAEGVEFNPDMVEYSKRIAAREGVADKTNFVKADFYEYDFSKATVITMFLLPEINRKLRPQLLELKPGTRIITNSFSMQDWPYDEMRIIEDESITWNLAYLWIVPAKVEGNWKCNEGQLKLIQNYQTVSGTLKKGVRYFDISEGKLEGDIFSFTCNEVNYRCRVDKNSMNGTSRKGGVSEPWTASRLQ
ncbi:methyltransferase domain-containing protein [Maribellus comscasis]|uniref:Methyltransferase domain-containing protein n=1 Tax=Maribellus comscasis TaxID=2681766 RepID=A0A6I6JNH5_9BACT|nr:class I SAM-dependent methyltransferase [Maribellus comscasis]QGY44506.1 methyltransferase domain-containing protein [Maribellus comscasis]